MESCIWVMETIGSAAYAAYPLCPDAVPQWQIEQKLHRVFSTSL